MTYTEVRLDAAGREELMRGVDVLANAVKSTLGPKGRTVLIKQPFGPPRVSNDGVTVAKSIHLGNTIADMGAEMVREVAVKTSELAGDGTTTATVIAQAIVREGLKATAAGMNAMDVKRGIDLAVRSAVADLRTRSRAVAVHGEIEQVGTISANGEREIGELIAKAVDKVGREGAITIEDAKSLETTLEVVEGMKFDRGYVSPYFVTETQHMTAELENPLIMLVDRKLAGLQPLIPLLEQVVQAARPLLIVAEDIEGEVLATLVLNKLRGGLKVAAVKAPGFGDRRKAMLEDMAILTGAQLLAEDLGIKLENVRLDQLGSARRVTVEREATTIVGGSGRKPEIEARCAQLREEIEHTTSDYDREKLKERLAKLSGGVAVVKVGGATEIEVKERKDRVEDAMHATRAAIEEGIVAGGGVSLLYASLALDSITPENDDQRVGVDIVRRALHAPTRQIAANAGADGALIVSKLLQSNDHNFGYDAQRGRYCDMIEAGIIDPTKVMRTALQDAASVAGLMITTDVLILEKEEKRAGHAGPGMEAEMAAV